MPQSTPPHASSKKPEVVLGLPEADTLWLPEVSEEEVGVVVVLWLALILPELDRVEGASIQQVPPDGTSREGSIPVQ